MPTIQMRIAGAKHQAEAVELLKNNTPDRDLVLEPDPENEFDANAIKVMLDGEHVGFIPRSHNVAVGDLLQQGKIVAVRRAQHSSSGQTIVVEYSDD